MVPKSRANVDYPGRVHGEFGPQAAGPGPVPGNADVLVSLERHSIAAEHPVVAAPFIQSNRCSYFQRTAYLPTPPPRYVGMEPWSTAEATVGALLVPSKLRSSKKRQYGSSCKHRPEFRTYIRCRLTSRTTLNGS